MEYFNTIISVLAMGLSLFAIIQSSLIAKKSNEIALLSQRVDFYNKIIGIIDQYRLIPEFKNMLNAKNSNIIFGEFLKTSYPITLCIINHLSDNSAEKGPKFAFQKIDMDINYLTINKYLFNDEIEKDVTHLEEKLVLLKRKLGDCFSHQSDNDIQDCLDELRKVLCEIEKETKPKIIKMISRKH